jgi:hypothetical protein
LYSGEYERADTTAEEQAVHEKIDFNPRITRLARPVAVPQRSSLALQQRQAIPRGRLEYSSILSPSRVVVDRLVSSALGEKIRVTIFALSPISSSIFYFIHGWDLPRDVVEAFGQEVDRRRSMLTGSDPLEVAEFARQLTRSRGLDTNKAPEEFCKWR